VLLGWELLFYLEGWLYNQGPNKAKYKPLLSTQFPYYLLQQKGPGPEAEAKWLPLPQMNMKILTDTASVAAGFRDALRIIYKDASDAMATTSGVVLTDPTDAWTTAKANEPRLDASDWARTRIAGSWSRLSPVPPTAHAAVGLARVSTTNGPVQAGERLSWFRVESHDSDALDGSAWVKYASSPGEQQLWPDPSAVPPVTLTTAIPRSPAVLGKRPNIDTFPPPATNVDPTSAKRMRPSFTASVWQSSANQYSPAPGTNPDENDDMLVGSDQVDSATRARRSLRDDDGAPILHPQPEPGLPGLPIGNPPPLRAPYYFICSSVVQYDGSPGPQVKQLALADPLNNFLSTLHLQGLILAGTPEPSRPTALHSQDEFQAWFADALGVGSSQAPPVTVTIDSSSSAAIDTFTLTVPALGRVFGSAATIDALDAQQSWGLGPASTVPWQNSLILGLKSASKRSGFTLIDILAPATDRGAALPALQILQLALGDKLSFDLDMAKGSRNAVWFEPMMGYKTTVRTQYLADPTSLENMNSWIGGFLSGFTVKSITAITKLRSSWVSTKDAVAALNEWEFVITTTVKLADVDVVPSVTFDFVSSRLTMTLQFDDVNSGQGSLLDQIIAWVGKQKPLQGAQFLFRDWLDNAGSSNFDLPLFRRLVLSVDLDPRTGLPTGSIEHLRIDLELGVKFGQSNDAKPEKVIFLFSYTWSKGEGSALKGALWTGVLAPPPPPPAPPLSVPRRR
jgi:hypothetical protein